MHLFLWNSIWLAKNEANAVLCDGPNQGLWGQQTIKWYCLHSAFFSPLTKLVQKAASAYDDMTRCLKIKENVSFNIASEASYVYILSGQKFNKNAKNDQFWRVFELWSNSVTRQVNLDRTKIDGKCQSSKIQTRHFEDFSNNVYDSCTSPSFSSLKI